MHSANIQFELTKFSDASAQISDALSMLTSRMPRAAITVTIHAYTPAHTHEAYQYFSPGERGVTLYETFDADAVVEDVAKKIEADPYRDQLEVVTRGELTALLNQYAAKHPKKNEAAREVLKTFGGPRLTDVAEENWPKVASVLRAYLEQA